MNSQQIRTYISRLNSSEQDFKYEVSPNNVQSEEENEQRIKDVISREHFYNLFRINASAANKTRRLIPRICLLRITSLCFTFEGSRTGKYTTG